MQHFKLKNTEYATDHGFEILMYCRRDTQSA